MIPRSIIEAAINKMALSYTLGWDNSDPGRMADCYIHAAKHIREKLEKELEIGETK